MSGFLLDLATLPAGASRVEASALASELGLPEAEWVGPVQGDLLVDRSGDEVSVRGALRATVRQECSRCLREFESPVEVEFGLYADRTGRSRGLEEDLERDHYMRFHDGRRLDLTQDARETLLLEVPITPRCREDCRGLCPRCGADLNLGPCGCPAEG